MGLSSSKTKTKSTTSSTPLDQYAPYISQGLTTAQGVLNDNQANLGQMSQSAYGLYNNLASSIGADSTSAGNARNVAAGIYGSAAGSSPGASTYAGLMHPSDAALGGLGKLAQGSSSPGSYDGIGMGNPALAMLSGMTTQSANPDSAQFYRDTLAGKFLNANPYIDAIARQADDAATKAANQRFGAAGMGNGLSTAYVDLLSRNIADSEDRLRYGAYNDELTRMGTIGAQSDTQYNATQDRSLNAANSLGSLYNQTGQLQLSAQQARDAAFQSDRAAQLAANQALGQQQTADNTTALNAATAADAQYNQQIEQQLKALGLIPQLTDAQYAGVSPALSVLQSAASIPYTGVNNYAGLVNGLTGKYGNETTNSTQTTSGNIGEMLRGLAGSALSSFVGSANFGNLLHLKPPSTSDVRAKRDIRHIGTLADGLGVYTYRYLWDDEPRIGVMAQEVAAIRPWALGPIQDGYMTVNYGSL
jgi:hypothetical protein